MGVHIIVDVFCKVTLAVVVVFEHTGVQNLNKCHSYVTCWECHYRFRCKCNDLRTLAVCVFLSCFGTGNDRQWQYPIINSDIKVVWRLG